MQIFTHFAAQPNFQTKILCSAWAKTCWDFRKMLSRDLFFSLSALITRIANIEMITHTPENSIKSLIRFQIIILSTAFAKNNKFKST